MHGEFWNTSDVTYYTFRCYLRANDVKSIRYRDADCWCPQLSILHTTPEFVISFHLLVPVSGPTLLLITIEKRPLATRSPSG